LDFVLPTATIVITESAAPLNDSVIAAGVEVALSGKIAGSVANRNLQLILRDDLGKLVATCSTTNGTISDPAGGIASITIPAIATASIKKNTKISYYFQSVSTANTTNTLSVGEFLIAANSGTPAPTPTPDSAQGQTYQWVEIAGNSLMVAGTGYACTGLSLQTLTLPIAANVGDRLAIWGANISLFRIAQNAGQQIRMGDKKTSIGIAGRIDSLSQGDFLELFYLSNQWVALPSQGNFDIA
jgi:hypothetical protein